MVDYIYLNRWIWQQPDWPHFRWQDGVVLPLLRDLWLKQGLLLGRLGVVGDELSVSAALDALLQNIITSSAIEGEMVNAASIRSSLAKRLGVVSDKDTLSYPTSARTEGLAELMMDAVQHWDVSLSVERLFQWHSWLFPDSEPRLVSIRVGQLRGNEPMQVVSGRLDRPKVHFEAPPRDGLGGQLDEFVEWFNASRVDSILDPFLRAAIAHFWFITLHPFDDGNGRLARVLTDLALAQADQQSIRLYAMSVVILDERSAYYQVLEQAQSGDMDITTWLEWFCKTLDRAFEVALSAINTVLEKRRFWQQFHAAGLSPEQVKVLNRLLDGGERGFAGGISAAQYQKVAKVSKATATRHLADLVNKGCVEKLPAGGRSTRYHVPTVV